MAVLQMVKPIRDTKKFNKNQKCWIYGKYGDLCLYVKGKHRGRNRYIMAWLHEKDYRGEDIKDIKVTEKFYQFIMGFSSDYLKEG